MDDLIMIKSGTLGDKTKMPTLNEDELGYITDKKELHIGTKDGNVRLCGADDVARLDALIAGIIARLDAISPTV